MLKKILLSTVFTFCVLNAQEAPRASLVEVQTLKKQEVNDLQEFVGTVNFDKKSKIASESSGWRRPVEVQHRHQCLERSDGVDGHHPERYAVDVNDAVGRKRAVSPRDDTLIGDSGSGSQYEP